MIYNFDKTLRITSLFLKQDADVDLIIGPCAFDHKACLCRKHLKVPTADRVVMRCNNPHGTCPDARKHVHMHSECYFDKCKPDGMKLMESKLGGAKKTGEEAEKSVWAQRFFITQSALPKCACGSRLVPVMTGKRGAELIVQVPHSEKAPSLVSLRDAQNKSMSSASNFSTGSSSSSWGSCDVCYEDPEVLKEEKRLRDANRELKKRQDAAKKHQAEAEKHAQAVFRREQQDLRKARTAMETGNATPEQKKAVEMANLAASLDVVLSHQPSFDA